MRKIERTTRFRRDYKREVKIYGKAALEAAFIPAIRLLCADASLPKSYADHAMSGNWKDYRDCHIKPDLVLTYQKPDSETLLLVRLGSHSELGI
jgi:mRNA interferase YafQ